MRTLWNHLPTKLKVLLVTMIIANIGSGIFGPFMALYVKDLGASVTQVGLYFSIMAIAPVAFRILGGWFSDSAGRVATVAVGSVAGLIGFVALWLAPTWRWLIPGGLMMALGRSLVGPSFRAYVAECADESIRAQVFGFADSLFLICEIIGPPLGGTLAQASGYRVLFGAATAFMVVATALRVWNAWDVPPKLGRVRLQTLKTGLGGIGALIVGGGLLTWIFVVDAARDFGFALSWELRPLFQKGLGGLGDGQIGWLASLGAVTMAVLMTPGGKLADRIGERKVMVAGGLLEVGALLVFVNARGMAGFALSAVLMSTAWALFGPAFDSLLSKAVPTSQLGLTYGLFETTLSVVAMPAPWIGASLWHAILPQLPFYLTSGIALATLPLIWLTFRAPARAEALPEGEPAPVDVAATGT